MIVLDATVVNVALPSIKNDLDFTQNNLAWVVNAYLIAFGGLLLLAGRLGDLLGHRRVFLVGLAVFTGASLLCALAQSQGMLIAARFVQGAGGAAASAVTLGMIVTMFPEPREQAKAIGVFGFVASAGGSIGLLAGGILTDLINWHWIFFVNVPIGVATALLALRLVDSRPGIGISEGADAPGAVLVTAGLMLAVYTILGVEEHGWTSARTLILAAVSVGPGGRLRAAAGAHREAADAAAPVPLAQRDGREHRDGPPGGGHVRRLLPRSALPAARARVRPASGGARVPPRLAAHGRAVARLHGQAEHALRAAPGADRGPGLLLVAMLLFARTPVDGNYLVDVFPAMFIFGAGAGVAFPALMMLAMSGATPQDAGLASGLVNTTGQVGGAIGLALLATISTERTKSLLDDGESTAAALTGGFHVAYLIGAALAVVAIVAAVTVLPARARRRDGGRRRRRAGRAGRGGARAPGPPSTRQ